jgi:outer membrane protein TolC
LVRAGLGLPGLSLAEANAQALLRREDLKVAQGRVEDAQRKIEVAENALGPAIDLVFNTRVPTPPDNHPAQFRFDQATWNAGLNADLPLNRLRERNDYRTALINLERAERNYGLLADTVILEVRDAWRGLQQAQESYAIQENSVGLARRRVDSTTLLLQAGRASTRDMLESQAALVEAENAFVQALTDHTIARLEFHRDAGILDVTEPGFLRPAGR